MGQGLSFGGVFQKMLRMIVLGVFGCDWYCWVGREGCLYRFMRCGWYPLVSIFRNGKLLQGIRSCQWKFPDRKNGYNWIQRCPFYLDPLLCIHRYPFSRTGNYFRGLSVGHRSFPFGKMDTVGYNRVYRCLLSQSTLTNNVFCGLTLPNYSSICFSATISRNVLSSANIDSFCFRRDSFSCLACFISISNS